MAQKRFTAITIPSMKAINARPKKWDAISLFAGCGGASTGLKLAGYNVLYANEFVPSAQEVYKANMAKNTYLDPRDVREIQPEEILKIIKKKKGELDYMDASPPCKMYSSAARFSRGGKTADEVVKYSDHISQRVDDLFDNFLRIRDGIMPKVFVAENVPGLTQSISKGFFLEIMKKMRVGYDVEACLIDPSKLGVPQRRVRVVFVGVRKDLGLRPVFPKPGGVPTVGVRDVIPDARKVLIGKAQWEDARRPGPTLTAGAHSFDEMSSMSAGGFYQTDKGEVVKFTIPQLVRYFGFPQDFRLDVDVPNKRGVWKPSSFGQQWERLGRTHVPLQVAAVATEIGEKILDVVNAPGFKRKAPKSV